MMRVVSCVFFLLYSLLISQITHASAGVNNENAAASPPTYNVKEYTFHTVLDHFRYQLGKDRKVATLPLRYLVIDDYYKEGGPVFFYAGNEADIYLFVENSGFMMEAAVDFDAMVVFAEHRYYGTSLPPTVDNQEYDMSFLTVEQAMEDYNALSFHIRNVWNMADEQAFVVWGGSYGANLALWMRLKNPNLWAGAMASSATPLKHLLRESNAFTLIETQAYENVSSICPDLVRQGWKDLYRMASSKDKTDRTNLAETLGLCGEIPASLTGHNLRKQQDNSPDDNNQVAETLHGWISDALETMVQYGYPYPTSFYNPVPAFPFKVACEKMIEDGTGLGALRAAIDIYYNYTGQAGSCYDFLDDIQPTALQYWNRKGHVDRIHDHVQSTTERRAEHKLSLSTDEAWNYQTCTEVYQPMPTDGITDFEVPYTPNQQRYYDRCWERWGVAPRQNWEEHHFMGFDIGTGTNIFLTNGQLDPWRAAGIQSLPPGADSSSLIIRTISDAAHHLDLRPSHPLDPPSLVRVRQEEKEAFGAWIAEWKALYSAV